MPACAWGFHCSLTEALQMGLVDAEKQASLGCLETTRRSLCSSLGKRQQLRTGVTSVRSVEKLMILRVGRASWKKKQETLS